MIEEMEGIRRIRNANKEHRERLSPLDHFALWVTRHVGSTGFFLILVVWTILWLLWNTFAPHGFRFDPFPAFELWLFITNTIQIFLLPLILLGQNLQRRHSELRAETEFEVNLKSGEEVERILAHLEHHDAVLQRIADKLDNK